GGRTDDPRFVPRRLEVLRQSGDVVVHTPGDGEVVGGDEGDLHMCAPRVVATSLFIGRPRTLLGVAHIARAVCSAICPAPSSRRLGCRPATGSVVPARIAALRSSPVVPGKRVKADAITGR